MKNKNIIKKFTTIALSLCIFVSTLSGFHTNTALAVEQSTVTNTPPAVSLSIAKKQKVDVNIIYGTDDNYNSLDLANDVAGDITSELTGSGVDANVSIGSELTTPPAPVTFSSSGAYTVPVTGVYQLETWGQQGLDNVTVNTGVQYGGEGGYATGDVTLTAGTILYYNVNVGGGIAAPGAGGNGGGASDFRLGGNTLYNRILVAGGGGGMAWSGAWTGDPGGGLIAPSEGGLTGQTFLGGGTQTAGGQGAYFNSGWPFYTITRSGSGSLGQGGNTVQGGGAGGGGYYGGGAGISDEYGSDTGGAGGSSYIGGVTNGSTIAGSSSVYDPNTMPSPTGGTEIDGHKGNGYAKITPISTSGFSSSSLNERDNALHFTIDLTNLAFINSPLITSPSTIATLEDNNEYLIGALPSSYQTQVNVLISELEGRGTYINNTDLTTSLKSAESYIMSIVNSNTSNDNIFLVGDELNYTTNYSDYESDLLNARQWMYTQDDTHLNYTNANSSGKIPLDNNLGMASFANGLWSSNKVTIFNNPGTYNVSTKVQDNPRATAGNPSGNPNFNNFNEWSQPTSATINIVRKPVAVLAAYATLNKFTGLYDITENDTQSYGVDHDITPITITNGTIIKKDIVSYSLEYINVTSGVTDIWHAGSLPSAQPANQDFLVKLVVTSIEGIQSDPVVVQVVTGSSTLPPVAQFTENETNMPVDQTNNDEAPSDSQRSDVVFTDDSYDPGGNALTENWTVTDSNGNNIYTGSVMPTASNFYGQPLGSYTISLVCNNGTLSSNTCTQTLTLVPIQNVSVTAQIVPYDDTSFTGTPTLEAGQKAILKIYTTDNVNTLNITFPTVLTSLDPTLNRTMSITPQASSETDITFNVPRHTPEASYTVKVQGTNSAINITKEADPPFIVQGDILDGFRTTIINSN